jgi:hypothetical protein
VYIQEATSTILQARKVLKDTYVYGYFLPEHVNRALFEFHQGELERNTELLSGLVEQKPPDVFRDRLKIVDLDKALRTALQNTLLALEKGDVKGGQGAAVSPDAEWTKVVAPACENFHFFFRENFFSFAWISRSPRF